MRKIISSKIIWLAITASAVCCTTARANISLPAVFSDNMVLQQNAQPAIWGKSKPGSSIQVTTSWNNQTYSAKADENGNWKVQVKTGSFGGPYQVSISGDGSTTLHNVLIGDVWLCSGQSNMEMPLAGWGKVNNYEQEIAGADHPQIRLLQSEQTMADTPVNEMKIAHQGWEVCSPKSVGEFSATAYFFAREVYEKTKIPIGLIHASWGGTVAEAWVSYDFLAPFEGLYKKAAQVKNKEEDKDYSKALQALIDWEEAMSRSDAGYKNGKPAWSAPVSDVSGWQKMKLPAEWENEGLIDLDGIVWFRKKITIPDALQQQDLYLRFKADDDDITWFNGKEIGKMYGWAEERIYKIPKELIKKGSNEIVIRVFDTGGGGGVYSDDISISNKNGNTLSLKGDWHYRIGCRVTEQPQRPESENGPNRPTVLYNAMIHPFTDYAIKGVIWYQGESNVGRAEEYCRLFPMLINNWRKSFRNPELPFYFVQLANYLRREESPLPSQWALLREAQANTLRLSHTGMALAIDIGDAADIHPKNKQEVGRRLALNALAKDYHLQVEYSGPAFESYGIEGNRIRIRFSHAGGLKTADGGTVKGFAVAGADKRFYWANAVISNGEVIVESKAVKYPLAVRYGWANNPEVNLCNEAGLPAIPFRTDDW